VGSGLRDVRGERRERTNSPAERRDLEVRFSVSVESV